LIREIIVIYGLHKSGIWIENRNIIINILKQIDACELNPIRGRVIQVAAENSKILLVVDAGIHIVLLIPPKKYEQTRPLVGEFVGVCIPPEAIQILKSNA